VSYDSRYAYVANEGSHDVSLLDLQREVVINTIPVGRVPQGIATSPDGAWLYVANFGSNTVSVIATARNEVEAEIPVGNGPVGIAVSPDGRLVYTGNFRSGSLSLIDVLQRKQIADVPIGQETLGVAVDADGRQVYIVNGKDRQLSVGDAVQPAVKRRIGLGQGPFQLAVVPEFHFRLQSRHFWMALFVAALGILLIRVTQVWRWQQTSEFDQIQTDRVPPDVPAHHKEGTRETVSPGQRGDMGESISPYPDSDACESVPPGQRQTQLNRSPQGATSGKWRLPLQSFGGLRSVAIMRLASSSGNSTWLLAGIFVLGLGLRVVGLNWGIPVFDADTAKAAPELRVSFHLDEDNFLWNLTRVRPESFDFYVPDFHWGTLQYHLVEVALLVAQSLGFISTPWRESFLNFHPIEYARVFIAGRAVSAILGSCSIFVAYGIGNRLYGRGPGVISALVLAILPVHVVNSHYLTSDVSMVFFLLLAFLGLISSFKSPSKKGNGLAGLAAGLAITAKYNAVYLLPVAFLMHLVSRMGGWGKKVWFYPGVAVGFQIGEPYALIYRRQFWESIRPYLQTGNLPEGAVPGIGALLSLQVKNMAVFGFGFALTLALILVLIRLCVRISTSLPRQQARSLKDVVSQYFRAPKAHLHLILGLMLVSFVLSMVLLRQPMLRYALPVMVFLIFPTANFLSQQSFKPWTRGLVITVLFLTGMLSLLQVEILTQEHTVNQAFQWIERHVPAGASIKKGWPEIPVLNPKKFQITNFFAQKRMADFREYFSDEAGQPDFPDYVLLDTLPTLDIPPEFVARLQENYCLVAEFKRLPRLGKLEFPEWEAPHDWRYTHPSVRIYRRRR
jgi:YVTN family beta-propeller protein